MSRLKQMGLVFTGVCLGVLISLNYSANATREATPSVVLPVEDSRNFAEIFKAIQDNYVDAVEDKKLINDAISGMVSGLDPHSEYLDADAMKDLEVTTTGEFGGLGIEVSMEDGFVKVVSPIEDTPAFRAGVKAGDLIIKLDDLAVKGLSLNDAVKHMRGTPGTQITLTIARKGETKPIVMTLTRKVIKVQSVKSKLIEPGYGYVRIAQFQEQTAGDVAQQIEHLYKQGPLKGLVLDLRNNPGGLLNSAIGVSAAFLPAKSLVVYTDGRTAEAKRKFYAKPDDYRGRSREDVLKGLPEALKKLPMVVIVNGGSASASEIVAGALQDHSRAKILGIQTFGKGSVQTVLPISATASIKITTARYFTPNNRSIQAKGIVPDYVVDETPNGTGADVFLREADLNRHLANPNDPTADASAPAAAKPKNKPAGKDKGAEEISGPKFEFGSKEDYQLQQAMNYLKGQPVAVVPVASSSTPAEQSAPAGDKP